MCFGVLFSYSLLRNEFKKKRHQFNDGAVSENYEQG